MGSATPAGGLANTPSRYEQVVRTNEDLPPTTKTLAALQTFTLLRRRDAQGCVRAPLTNARKSDTAAKSDCGGTPGAALTIP